MAERDDFDDEPNEDETPRRIVAVESFRIGRTPVTDEEGVPLTYV